MENAASQKIALCQVCGAPTGLSEAAAVVPEEVASAEPHVEDDQSSSEVEVNEAIKLRDPCLNPLDEIVLDTGTLPCSIHGHDHLVRDPSCEFCKRAVGPLSRHLNKKYGSILCDRTRALSFDFSGPHRML